MILFERGAVGGVDIRGSATGTEEIATLDPLHAADRMHAIVLAGGSAFGLEAASGVRRYLERQGVGFDVGVTRVPIVPAAILFDLAIGKHSVRPTRDMGESAAAAASNGPVAEGCVGAGTGATVGKMLGMKQAMKGGIGSATVELEGPLAGVKVAALAAVNPLGDVRDPKSGRILAGARRAPDSFEFADSRRLMKRGGRGTFAGNTTLVVAATNAQLTKVEAQKMAQLAQLGLARTIDPIHTMSDGDIVFAVSLGTRQAPVDALGTAAAEAVSVAIVRAVEQAWTLGGVPGLRKQR